MSNLSGLFEIKTTPMPFPPRKISGIFTLNVKNCCVCNENAPYDVFFVFMKKDGTLIKTPPGRPESKPYFICEDCFKKTQRKLKKVNKLNRQYLPLHISNTNPIVRDFAIQKLEIK